MFGHSIDSKKSNSNINKVPLYFIWLLLLFYSFKLFAQVTLEREVKITDIALHFDGVKVTEGAANSPTGYDYAFGPQISAHGDCVATYKHYVFMTWYKGGKSTRNMMLTRYNTLTGSMATIEFPHRHTGFRNIWWIGESHNTIGIGVSPKDGTIHLLFDMHAYTQTRPSDGSLANDYFRYSYSKKDAADVPDEEFTLDQFVEDNPGDYTHLSLNGVVNYSAFSEFTYPKFFLNNEGDLFFSMRKGSSSNGGYHFARYDAALSTWSNFIKLADRNAKNYGQAYNWGMYGRFKYVGNKIRIGFQRRLGNTSDKYKYQNGFYYAYSDDQSGQTNWKNYKGEPFNNPLRDADIIKVSEPGDLVQTTQKDQVYMVGGFDWTVTDRGDVHIIGKVRDDQYNITKNVHTYKPAGASEFITTTNFSGASTLYTSGNNIYIIGLNSSGRVYIEQSEGGTNNFQRVYEATTGTQFRHGVAYINSGKLYYYMMERNSGGDQRPLYLQIIDLDLDTTPDPFAVSLITPADNQTFKQDHIVPLSATASADEGEITKVSFLADGNLLDEDTTKPYAFDWIPDALGFYTVKAVAYKTSGESISSSEATIEVVEYDKSDLTNDVYRLRNKATGKFLTDAGAAATAVGMSDSGEVQNTHWTFVPSGDFFNIDSETFGILRATGSTFSGGANLVVSTAKPSPAGDTDKVFTIHYDQSDDTFRFEARNNNKYLYHAQNGSVVNISTTTNDARSKWEAISTSQALHISQEALPSASIQIFPNPAKDRFTILFEAGKISKVIIYNMLGKILHSDSPASNSIDLENKGRFKPGLYFIKVIDENQNVFNSKLMIK